MIEKSYKNQMAEQSTTEIMENLLKNFSTEAQKFSKNLDKDSLISYYCQNENENKNENAVTDQKLIDNNQIFCDDNYT